MLLSEKLRQVGEEGKALLATNFYNWETLSGILHAARARQRPVILQLSESSITYMGLDVAASMARAALRQFEVTGWLHLDHGSSINLIQHCLDAGFDSVMIDASEKSFEENVKITKEVVDLAAGYKANVEAELGYVAKLGQRQEVDRFTQPEEAKRFVEETGVHALAIAVGSAHGFYKQPPELQIDLIGRIHAATKAALVLHGSSGIPDDQLKVAIANGIAKVNLATETKNTFMKALRTILHDNDEIDLRQVFPAATREVVELIENKLSLME